MPYARQCVTCGQVVAPRGNLTPRFCPSCGHPLGGAPVEAPPVPHRRQTAGGASASLVFGLFSFIPLLGVLFALLAIGFSRGARKRIRLSHGMLRGKARAVFGSFFGWLSILAHLAVGAVAVIEEIDPSVF